MKKLKNLILLLFLISVRMPGQVGINTATPKATLDINRGTSNIAEGVLVPSFTVDDLAVKDNLYTDDQNGAIVFITEGVGSSGKTLQINGVGFYYYDAPTQLWTTIGTKNSWSSIATGLPASSNDENIYQTGQVSIGNASIDSNAQLDVTSSSKGVLIPRMSKIERDAITTPSNGLIIFNINTNCLNYYDGNASKWLSLCGTYEPASFNVLSCTNPTGVSGTFTQGSTLNNTNIYTISLNITDASTYQILGNTSNGYTFSKSGVFTQTGNQVVTLEGQGTPINGPQDDSIYLTFNGIAITPSCSLPSIHVNGSTTAFNINCSGAVINGTYYTRLL